MISFLINIYNKEKFTKMANIKNNNFRKIDCRLFYDTYMDFMLSKDETISYGNSDNCLAAKLDFKNVKNKQVISNIAWENAVSSNKILENIGYTGVDNGFISYERDRIGNDEFLEMFMNSTFDLSTYSDKFFVTEVNGNQGMLVYPIEKKDDYTALKGGFYQGFFKVDGDSYQTLPHRINDEWNFNFTLRRKDYETPSNTLNKRNENNDGIFFYIGSRAENKFWEMYKSKPEMNDLKYDDSNDYSIDYSIMDSEVTKHQYHEDEPHPEDRDDKYGDVCECLDYFADDFDPYGESTNTKNCKNDYFSDGYTGENATICDCPSNNLAIDDEYMQEQMSLENVNLIDSKGNKIGEKGFYEIETDNKFIIFNQTKYGYTTKTWKDYYKFVMYGKKDSPNINYFQYLNQTKDGYTKKNINKLIEEHSYAYDVFKDIENNAFGLKINKDGSISYRYLTTNCELIEETSKPNLVNKDEWTSIHLKIVRKGSEQPNNCDENYKPEKMQLYIYVNGYLKFISKELPELFLKALNDNPERQEGVPYTLSIGGGSQGLSERVLLNYYNRTDYILPIEKYFAGTFIGDIKSFDFTPCRMDFNTIYRKISGF